MTSDKLKDFDIEALLEALRIVDNYAKDRNLTPTMVNGRDEIVAELKSRSVDQLVAALIEQTTN
jgi:hypothetical protein